MKLTDENWVDLLSKDYPPAKEKVVIIIGKLSGTLKIRKADWQAHFSDFGGIEIKHGDEIEIVRREDGGAKAEIPEQPRERLESGPRDAICITRRDGRYFLKKINLVEQLADVPAAMIIDKFDPDRVERSYWNRTGLDEFTYGRLNELVSAIPKFRYDPVAPFEDMTGRIGLLGRREFLGGITKADEAFIGDYTKEICQDQQDDGSWEDSATQTAFRIIRLLEVGATMENPAVERGANWLLKAKEPLGLPGMYMISEKTTESFNAWKARQEADSRKRGSRTSSAGQRRLFMENKDIFGTSNSYCEVKLTWSTGVVLEALLWCGLHEEPRVHRAINTLLSIGSGGGWCGCGYFVADIYRDDSAEPPDLNSHNFHVRGREPGSVGLKSGDILNVAGNGFYRGYELENGSALMVRTGYAGTGDCAMAVNRGLSYHPEYHGSNLEMAAALACSSRQGWLGDWTGNYTSFFLSLLSRFRCPLSAYLVLRSIPLLVRKQGKGGLWQEEILSLDPRKPIPVPTKEESTFMILTALKTFGFLEALRPA